MFEQKDHKILENCLFAKTNPLWLPGWRLPQSLWCVQGSGSIVAFQVHAPLYSKVMQALWYVQGEASIVVWQVPAGVAAVTVDSVVYPWSELVRSTGQTWSPLGTLLSLTSCRDSENTHKGHINWRKLHSAAGVSWFIVISRDLTLSRASLCALVARLSEGLCVCVCLISLSLRSRKNRREE